MKKIYFAMLVAMALMITACHNGKKDFTNPHMTYRPLGNTGLNVSEISIGCAAFGNMSKEESLHFMALAMDSGINYIDLYDANPTVRDNIGYALQGVREHMIIQGHIGSYWDNGQYKRTRDIEEVKAGFEDMLQRLHTDFIDVGMIHIVDEAEEWARLENSEYMAYVKQLKQEGKIHHIGVSSHNAEAALAAAKSGLVEVIMFSLNPAFDRLSSQYTVWDASSYEHITQGIDPVRVELYDYCAQHHIAITAMKVFGGGGKLLKEADSPLHIALTPVQCLAYALAKPCVATAICGAKTDEELLSDLHYLYAANEEKDYSEALLHIGNTHMGDHACTYCHHCSPCPKGIDIAKINKLTDEAEKYDKVPANLQQEYNALEHKAGECIGCGACESRCPFNVPVKERMQKAKEIFE